MATYKEVFKMAKSKGYKLQFVKMVTNVIPEGWELFRVKEYYKGKLDVKVRRLYPDGEVKYNEDGYEYKCIFIDKEPDEQTALLELTLIQKWLREERRIDININVSFYDLQTTFYNYRIDSFQGLESPITSALEKLYGYDSYEYALLEGINEALKLI